MIQRRTWITGGRVEAFGTSPRAGRSSTRGSSRLWLRRRVESSGRDRRPAARTGLATSARAGHGAGDRRAFGGAPQLGSSSVAATSRTRAAVPPPYAGAPLHRLAERARAEAWKAALTLGALPAPMRTIDLDHPTAGHCGAPGHRSPCSSRRAPGHRGRVDLDCHGLTTTRPRCRRRPRRHRRARGSKVRSLRSSRHATSVAAVAPRLHLAWPWLSPALGAAHTARRRASSQRTRGWCAD